MIQLIYQFWFEVAFILSKLLFGTDFSWFQQMHWMSIRAKWLALSSVSISWWMFVLCHTIIPQDLLCQQQFLYPYSTHSHWVLIFFRSSIQKKSFAAHSKISRGFYGTICTNCSARSTICQSHSSSIEPRRIVYPHKWSPLLFCLCIMILENLHWYS